MSWLVIEGVPQDVSEPREWDSLEHGTQKSVGFHLVHPEAPAEKPNRDGKVFYDLFEASNATADAIAAAAGKGAVVKVLCLRKRVRGAEGKADWYKYIAVKVL